VSGFFALSCVKTVSFIDKTRWGGVKYGKTGKPEKLEELQ
jgi:hypothetical protein